MVLRMYFSMLYGLENVKLASNFKQWVWRVSLFLPMGHFCSCYPIGTQISPFASGSEVKWVWKINPSYSSAFASISGLQSDLSQFLEWQYCLKLFFLLIIFCITYCCTTHHPWKLNGLLQHSFSLVCLSFGSGLANLGWAQLGNSTPLCRK